MITLRGYFGQGNVGDEALLTAFIEGLVSRGISPSDLHVLSRGSILPYSVLQSHPKSVKGLIRFLKSKILIFVGGSIIQDHVPSGARQLKRMLLLSRIAKVLGMRVCFHGISIGPLISNEGINLALRLFRLSDWIAVRDLASMNFLKNHGIQCSYSPDLSVLLGANKCDKSPSTVKNKLLFVPCGEPVSLEVNKKIWLKLLEISNARSFDVTLCSFHKGIDDVIVNRLKSIKRPTDTIFAWKMNPVEVLNVFKTYSHVVSIRLHGGWFAYLAARPLIQLIYHPKCLGFLETVKAPELAYLFPNDLVDDEKVSDQIRKFISIDSQDDSYYGVPLKNLQQEANKALDDLYSYLVKNGIVGAN